MSTSVPTFSGCGGRAFDILIILPSPGEPDASAIAPSAAKGHHFGRRAEEK
jgi:hypothetical protein